MKPDFALTLAEDGIGLQHRAKAGWRSLGEVSLHDPGLAETLRLLRATAGNLAEGRPLVALVIPDSQILYTELPVEGESRAEKHASLLRGLDGLTPYPVGELVFDWQETGGRARLAVVARETLAEAEAFAQAHQFDPVSFVARPPAAQFEGEASFGPTAAAATLLAEDKPAAPTPGARKSPRPATEAKPAPQTEPEAEPEPEAKTVPEARPAPKAEPAAKAEPAPKADPAPAPMPERKPAAADAVAPPSPPPAADPAPTATAAPAAPAARPVSSAPASPVPAAPSAARPPRPETPAGTGQPATAPPRAGTARRASGSLRPEPQPMRGLDLSAAARPSTGPEPMQILKLGGAVIAVVAAIAAGAILLPRDETPAPDPDATAGLVAPSGANLSQAEAPDPQPPFDAAANNQPRAEGSGSAPLAGTATGTGTPASPVPAPLSEAEALEAYASTGMWQRAPDPMSAPPQDRIEDLYLAGIDQAVRPPEAGLLPDPQIARSDDRPLPMQADPPGPDQTFELDERGLVEATPEGALTPDGVTVFRGAPAVVPSARPADLVPEPEPMTVPAPGNTADGAEITAEGVPVYGVRPETTPPGRPVDLAPPAGTAADAPDDRAEAPAGEDATAAPGETDPRPSARPAPRTAEASPPAVVPADPEVAARIASHTPRARPATVLARAGAPATAVPGTHPQVWPKNLAPPPTHDTDAAVTAALEDLADGEGEAASDLPENALSASLRPASRPSDFEDRVQSAMAIAVQPAIPTAASVARQATLPDAINLRDLNLIGVYGTSADRRALLRLPSGRFVKVKVGDKIDGGQVAAIGDTQLRYVKRGRNIVLDLPGG
ncbi:hypothetical protein [Rhodovulum sulfidophilum]|uniref:hypothetical protein n=1 Tax=Rhodovulum sulfidophilum TaxID=35806 RepID=UPI00095344D3|nr:hypothetical protein [Rhodovulum sulfidophilum]MBL3552497.1 hypothetical protein [Rhodovulum sulfidophilum]OLS49973.1 hypothetical protein BV379_17955 [Rhodovulum sulfidophilum]